MSSSSLKKNPEDDCIRTLYVGGIYGRITEQDIRDHFSAYSEVESIKMVPKRACAFVTYTSRKGAEKAANDLADNLEIKGLPLKLMWGLPPNEERQQSNPHNNLLPQLQQTQMIKPPAKATATASQQSPPLTQPVSASMDPQRMAEWSTEFSGSGPDENTRASVSGERVETQTMPSGVKRSMDRLEGMSLQEMRERVMRRKKGSSTSTPPPASTTVVPPVTPLVSAGMAGVGESSEETHLTRFVTSVPWDFLVQKSGVTTIWPDADSLLFPGPMNLLEKKSDIDLVNDATEMTLHAVQSTLMCRRRLVAQLGQQHVRCARLAEAEAAEVRMSSQLREAEAENLSLKEAAAAAEARAAAAVEARDARATLLMTVDAQIRELTEKLRLKSEEMQEELKDTAWSAGLRERANLMREFLDGKSSSWDPQAEIDFYVIHIGEEVDLVS